MKTLSILKKCKCSAFVSAAMAIAILMPVANAQADTSTIVLKPVNQKLETKACYVAATEGLEQAKRFIRSNEQSFATFNSSVKCNGQSIADFAQKYAAKTGADDKAIEEKFSQVKLVAMDNDASQVCVDAVIFGEKIARDKHDLGAEPVFCNSKPLGRFARSFKDKNVTL